MLAEHSPASIRPATERDAAAIAAVYAPYVDGSAISFEETAPSPAEMTERMLAPLRKPWLVAEADGTVVGFAYASGHRARAAYRWSVDVSVYIAPGWQRRGIGRLLYAALIAELRELSYVTAYAGIALPNAASVGLHESLGFTPVGVYSAVGYKFGEWRDVGWWSLRLVRELPAEPAEPAGWAPT